ncbi:MAG: hypothetical protein Q4F83_08715 [Eubacteriales bacterium]|nr:hypothetical protein [Eubacteriales bacterium]
MKGISRTREQVEQEKKMWELSEKAKEEAASKSEEVSPTWAEECIEDLDDWIESQGIYLRQ